MVTGKYQEVQVKKYCYKVIKEVTNVYNILSLYVSTLSTMEVDISVMSPVSNSVINLIEILASYFVDINTIETNLKKVLNPTFVVESSHPYTYEIKEPMKVTCRGAESFTVNYSYNSKFPPMDFMRAIRIINPSNNNDLLRVSNDTTNLPTQTLIIKDELELIFEYTDIKKHKLEYLVGHPAPDCYGFKFEIKPIFEKELLGLNEYLD